MLTQVLDDVRIGRNCAYTMVRQNTTVKFPNSRTFDVVLYGAYNALGLIGPECNGIAILDDDNKLVVLDEHCKESSGFFGANDKQVEEFVRIINMKWEDFVEFVNDHPRTREEARL